MNKHVEAAINRFLTRRNRFQTRLTNDAELMQLISKLHPMMPESGLIRLGPDADGGYLLPNDLEGIEACFSPGVSRQSGFERDCANLGMKVFMADASVAGPAESHDRFIFLRKFIGATTSGDYVTMDDWVSLALPQSDSDLMLQIDIEGYEYETFLSMSDGLLRRFRIIVAEFHNLGQLCNRPFFRIASRVFEKILHDHTCVHIHPNNCCGIQHLNGTSIPRVAEFTFLRNDRIKNGRVAQQFPHALDCDNTPGAHIALPKSWYGGVARNGASSAHS